MANYPKDRIDEERSVSPQPPPQAAQQPTCQNVLNYPKILNLDRQESETGDIIKYAGATQMPVTTEGKRRETKTKINYATGH